MSVDGVYNYGLGQVTGALFERWGGSGLNFFFFTVAGNGSDCGPVWDSATGGNRLLLPDITEEKREVVPPLRWRWKQS